MKLGTKIILGFLAISFIYIAISGMVFFNLIRVQHETDLLRDEIVLSNNVVANMTTTLALEGGYVTEFSLNFDEEAWRGGEETQADIVADIGQIRNLFRSGESFKDPKYLELLADLEKQNLGYQAQAARIPPAAKNLLAARTRMHEIYVFCDEKIEIVKKTVVEDFLKALAGDDNRRTAQLYSALELSDSIHDHSSEMYAYILRGLYYQDFGELDKAIAEG